MALTCTPPTGAGQLRRQLPRSSRAGSMRRARRAGPAMASTPTTTSTPPVTVNVSGIERIDVDQHRAERPAERRGDAASRRRGRPRTPARRRRRRGARRRRRRAERPPHGEVAQPLLHGVADDAEDADHRQRQRQAGEGDARARRGTGGAPSPSRRRPRASGCRARRPVARDRPGRWRRAPPTSAPRRRRWRDGRPGRCRRWGAARSAGRPGRTPPVRPGGRAPGGRRRRSRTTRARRAAATRAAARAARRAASGRAGAPRTSASLTRHTGGLSAVSRSVKPRPATIGSSIASKYAGLTMWLSAAGRWRSSTAGSPTISKDRSRASLRGQRQVAGPGDARRRRGWPRSRGAPRRRTAAATRGSGSASPAGRRSIVRTSVAR